MPSFIVKTITGLDNDTPQIAKLAAAFAVPIYLAMGIYDVVKNHHIDYLAFGGGFGAMVAGVGVAIGFGAGGEPKEKNS
jgi:hypothetical protein